MKTIGILVLAAMTMLLTRAAFPRSEAKSHPLRWIAEEVSIRQLRLANYSKPITHSTQLFGLWYSTRGDYDPPYWQQIRHTNGKIFLGYLVRRSFWSNAQLLNLDNKDAGKVFFVSCDERRATGCKAITFERAQPRIDISSVVEIRPVEECGVPVSLLLAICEIGPLGKKSLNELYTETVRAYMCEECARMLQHDCVSGEP